MKNIFKTTFLGVFLILMATAINLKGQGLNISVIDPIGSGTDYYNAQWVIVDNNGNSYTCTPNQTSWQATSTTTSLTFTATLPSTYDKVYRLAIQVRRPTYSEIGYKYSGYFNSYEFPYLVFYMEVKIE